MFSPPYSSPNIYQYTTALVFYTDPTLSQVLYRYYYLVPAGGLSVPVGTYTYQCWLSLNSTINYVGFLFNIYQTNSTAFESPVALVTQTYDGETRLTASAPTATTLTAVSYAQATIPGGKYLCLELRAHRPPSSPTQATISTGVLQPTNWTSTLTFPLTSATTYIISYVAP